MKRSEFVATVAEQNVASTPTATSATHELTPQGQRYNLHPWEEAHTEMCTKYSGSHANDPSAGSPTETLLRLLLPLSDKIH